MRAAEEQHQHQSSLFYELCYMILHILKPIPSPYLLSRPCSSRQRLNFFSHVSPAEFALLFLGVSLALMLFGSITFIIGFILMPWVIGLFFLFYLAGFLSRLSELAQSFFGSGDLPTSNLS